MNTKRKLWTEKDDKVLLELSLTLTRMQIEKLMNFSIATIKQHAKKLNIKFLKTRKDWLLDDISELKRLRKNGVKDVEIAAILNRTEKTISVKCSELHIESLNNRVVWSEEESVTLQDLISKNNNLTSSEIGEIMNRSSGVIQVRLRELGINSEKSKLLLLQAQLSKENLKKCYRCKIVKNRTEFYGHHRACIECAKNLSKITREALVTNYDIKKILKYKLSTAKSRAKKKGFEFDLDLEYLIDLYTRQNKKCYYSGQELSLSIRNENCISLDRINSSLGYIKDNIALCCVKINNLKQDLTKSNFIEICKLVASYN